MRIRRVLASPFGVIPLPANGLDDIDFDTIDFDGTDFHATDEATHRGMGMGCPIIAGTDIGCRQVARMVR